MNAIADRRHRVGSRSGNGAAGASRSASVAMVLPLSWQITNMAGWVARSVTSIFENIGTVQDGMRSIAVERQMPDPPDARELRGDAAARSASRTCISTTAACSHRARRRAARHRPAHRAGRARRAGWAVGRRQIDAGQPAAAFLRPGTGRILIDGQDIATGHAGEPAHADRHGDAGHVAAASLDPRQHPLRPAAGDPGDDRGRRSSGRGARIHPRWRTGTAGVATTRMSASAA